MFDNIGKKIKTLAQVFCWFGIITCIIVGIVFLTNYATLAGLLTMLVGPFACWIGSFALYGFGQLVDSSDELYKIKHYEEIIAQHEKRIEEYEQTIAQNTASKTEQ